MIRSVTLPYITVCPGGAWVTVTENNINAFAGTPAPALLCKRERLAGAVNCNERGGAPFKNRQNFIYVRAAVCCFGYACNLLLFKGKRENI